MKFCPLLIFLFIFQFQVTAQQTEKIRIDVENTALDEIFLYLREEYNLQFAFDEELLSNFSLSVHEEFNSKDEAIAFLLKRIPLVYEKSGEVFLILPEENIPPDTQNREPTIISGQVVEAKTFEPLPFSNIVINNKFVQADQQGNFTFLASADTLFDLHISHLGYYIYDTLVTGDFYYRFTLNPQVTEIAEVQVIGSPVERSTLVGDKPGKIKINQRIAPVLPGYGDNSVFNMLRLMPGILAAGEQSNDLLIWGSYESHSKIQFDGFTVFGLKNFNDDIGVVNPLVLKDMEVYKGGYDVLYGDRVGGIVNITGKNGSLQKPSFTFNINNTTVNSLLEVPVSKKSSLLAAYRQTFYELYDPSDLQLFNRRGNNSALDVTVVPDYNFRDANIKYSYQDKFFSTELSLYGGGDRYAYNVSREQANNTITRTEEEQNQQLGGSFQVYMNSKKGNTNKLKVAISSFANLSDESNKSANNRTGRERVLRTGNSENNVSQFSISEDSRINFKEGHYLELGIGFEMNNVSITREIGSESLINMDTHSPRLLGYIQDNFSVANKILFKAGVRANYVFDMNKIYPDPRLSASVSITDDLKLNVSWGLYHQFLAKTTLIDSALNYYYFWTNADNETVPVLSAQHSVGGISFDQGTFTANIEGYFKTTTGLSRFIDGVNNLPRGFYSGEGRSYGIDLFLKKEFKNNMAWISYNWSKAEEHFPFYTNNYYRPAPQDQRHEIKFAGVLNVKSFYFSANYVYGSGFERFFLTDDNGTRYIKDYSRLDGAVVYNFKPGKIKSQLGLSVLNILNTENIRLSNIRRIITDTENPLDVNAEAVPFTPTLFFKLSF